jgi:adenine-specific DNA-methyltransferase
MNLANEVINKFNLEKEYLKNTTSEHRKSFAQFFTPVEIARALANYILPHGSNPKKIIEPAFGLGIFSRTLREKFKYKGAIEAFEIDDKIIDAAKVVIDELNINLKTLSYLEQWGLKTSGIICNPPYLKFHDYDNLNLIALINKKLGLDLKMQTNIYALFIIKSISELEEGGRAAYIVPSEFMNADYGVAVKEYLIKSGMLRYVINFHFDELVFEEALTTATILLLENNKTDTNVTFININSTKELEAVSNAINSNTTLNGYTHYRYKLPELKPDLKWRNYYQETANYTSNRLVNFKKICKAKRGIATGANDYFSFNLSKANQHNIKESNLVNCITKSADVKMLFFYQKSFEELKNSDKKVFLVDLRIEPDQDVENYINLGLELEINKKFLTKNRNPWYALENKPPADIWVGVFNRDNIKFICNNSNALNLTCFHGIYINSPFIKLKKVIFLYFLTQLSKEIFDRNRREYGNGLSKYEPNDFNNSDIFDFNSLSATEFSVLENYSEELEKAQNDKKKSDDIINKVDEYFRSLL